MKELGEYLKEERESNSINIDEAAEDLKISVLELENIEAGNTRAFKDIYALRDMIKKYAKYLGLDVKKVALEFNDFLFEHTSKISIDDITEAKAEKIKEESKTIRSPYTKKVKKHIDFGPIVLCVLVFILIVLVLYLLFGAISSSINDKKSTELKNIEEVRYEFAY